MTTNFIGSGTVYPNGETISKTVLSGTNGQFLTVDSADPEGFSFKTGPAEILWTSGTLNFTGVSEVFTPDWSSVGKIDLNLYDIRYEFDIFYDYTSSGYSATFISMGLNNVRATSGANMTSNNAQTVWQNNLQSGGGSMFQANQVFQSRWYCGYAVLNGTDANFRCRQTLDGTISLIRRNVAQAGPPGNETANMNSRLLQNQFESNSVILNVINTDQMRIHINPNFDSGQQWVEGTGLWDTSFSNLWTSGSGTNTDLASGIFRISIQFADGATTFNRSGEFKYRIYRVRRDTA